MPDLTDDYRNAGGVTLVADSIELVIRVIEHTTVPSKSDQDLLGMARGRLERAKEIVGEVDRGAVEREFTDQEGSR